MLGSCRETEAKETEVSCLRVCVRASSGMQCVDSNTRGRTAAFGVHAMTATAALGNLLQFSVPAEPSDSLKKHHLTRLEGSRNKVMTHFGSWPWFMSRLSYTLVHIHRQESRLRFHKFLALGLKTWKPMALDEPVRAQSSRGGGAQDTLQMEQGGRHQALTHHILGWPIYSSK